MWVGLAATLGVGAPTHAPARADDSAAPAVLAAAIAEPPPRRPSLRRRRAVPDSVEGLPIARITIVPREVYDSEGHDHAAPIRRFANKLHVRTRQSTIREQLLFEPGDAWHERIGLETGRNLRSLDYLEPQRIAALRSGDSVDVLVETRDYWTTRPEVNFETSGSTQYGSVGFTERNVLGYGKSFSFAFRSRPSGNSRLFAYEDPALLGSRHRLLGRITRGEEETGGLLRLRLPFYAQDTPRAYGTQWEGGRSVPRLYHAGIEAARFDRRTESVDASFGVRLGNHETVQRLEVSFESLNRSFGPGRLAPGAPAGFVGPAEELRIRRLCAEWSYWAPRFVELIDVDRMDRIEDFDLGPRLAIKLGASPRFLGGTQDEAHARIQLDAAAENRFGFARLKASASSRLVPDLEELLGQVDARWYGLSIPGHTLVLAAHGVAGHHAARDFQVVIGGLNGLRAYDVQAVAGRRAWRLNAEERWLFSPAHWELMRLQSVLFLDAARAWGLGAEGTDWHHDAGVGLRIGLPMLGLAEVLRFDVAWPLSPTRHGRREPVLSFGSSQAF